MQIKQFDSYSKDFNIQRDRSLTGPMMIMDPIAYFGVSLFSLFASAEMVIITTTS